MPRCVAFRRRSGSVGSLLEYQHEIGQEQEEVNGSEQDVRASYCERQHAHHEGQDQENGVDCIDAENDRGAGDEPDGKDGRNSQANAGEDRTLKNVDGALQLIG